MKATLARVKAVAAKLGAAVDHADDATIIDAPAGKVWKANGSHCLSAGHNARYDGRKPDAYADLLERMAMGLRDCDTKDCDVCA